MISLDVCNKGFIPAKHYFNASIFRKDDQTFLAYRANKSKLNCVLAITELEWKNGRFMPFGEQHVLSFPEIYPGKHLFEDPRIFHMDDTIYIAFTNVNLENGCQCQGIASLTDDFKVNEVTYIDYSFNKNGAITPKMYRDEKGQLVINVEFPVYLEKNWSFFQHGDKINFIYQATPNFVVPSCRHNQGDWKKNFGEFQVEHTFTSTNNIMWPYGEIRGGTPPVEFDDNYFITFFHSSFDSDCGRCRTNGFDGRIYTVGAYLFSKKNYTIEYVTSNPLWTGDIYGVKALWNHAVAFPCGSFKVDNEWYVSYGLNDHKIKVMNMTHNELKEKFIKLPKTKDRICLPRKTK